MVSPTVVSIGPTTQCERIRPEWEIIDLETGTCKTKAYLDFREVSARDTTMGQISKGNSVSNTAFNAIPLLSANHGHYLNSAFISSPPSNTSVAISNRSVILPAEILEQDIRHRSRSTPSRLRGDAKCYVPRRATSLGSLPLHSAGVACYPAFGTSSSTLMTNDMITTSPALYHPTDIPAPNFPIVYISAPINTTTGSPPSPESPRIKYNSTFQTLEDSTLHLKTRAYRRLLLSPELSVRAKALKPVNPFISITRGDGSVQVTLKYTTMPIYSVTVGPGMDSGGKGVKKGAVGPFRAAAIWEFVGQTFAKYDRHKKLRPKRRRAIRESLDKVIPRSSLSNQILADDDETEKVFKDEEVRAEWTNFVSGTDSWDLSSPHYASGLLAMSSRLSTQERDFDRYQQGDRRGRLRTRANMLDQYSYEKRPPASSYPSTIVPFVPYEARVPEETEVNDEWDAPTNCACKSDSSFNVGTQLT